MNAVDDTYEPELADAEEPEPTPEGSRVETDEDATAEMSRPETRYEPLHVAAVYDTEIDLSDENDAHSLVVKLTGESKRVLKLGYATGSMSKVLQQRLNCTVVGIEIDADAAETARQYCERLIVGDLDTLDISAALGDDSFDVIIAADVLEHLRDPRRVLITFLDHLRPGGEVLLSIPNIAHADVRLSLLRGDFYYQWCGILDETHLRFFTRQTLETFLDDCGLAALTWDRTRRPFGETEVGWRPPPDEALVEWLGQQPDTDTYQFIVRAIVAPERSHMREAMNELRHLRAGQAAVDGLNAHAQRLAADNQRLAETVTGLEQTVADMSASIAALKDRADADRAMASAAAAEMQQVWDQVASLSRERDEYRSSFETLLGVQEELVATRRSESYRLGRALLSPAVTVRRIARAWHRARPAG